VVFRRFLRPTGQSKSPLGGSTRTMIWRTLALVATLSSAGAVRLQPHARALRRCSAPRCAAAPDEAVEGAAEAAAAAMAAADAKFDEDASVKLVPMSTSLGFEDMPTVVGPPVPTLKDAPKDGRSVFVSVGLFKKGLMPSEPLTTQHVEWLSQTATGVDVCRADYLNAQQSVDDIAELGVSLTEEELSAMAEKVDEGPPQGMIKMPQGSFVLGNLNVVKGSSLADVAAWGQGDPHDVVGAYESLKTYRWLRSPDPELNLPAPGPCYGVYCVDKPASSELRQATRDAHLAWLAEGGRVHLGGALQSPMGENAGNVGTLLFVNGDELEEVRRWATEDPYNQAGLFESVLVAPVTQYALSAAGGKLAEL